MKLTWPAFAITFVATVSSVNAYFQVNFPAVRGAFNQNNEPQFCGGYTQPANRTRFPLTSGSIVWETSNTSWTVGVMLSTASSPTSFSDFRTAAGADQLVVGYFQGNGTSGCIHVMPTAAGIPGVQNGSDVTFQMVFDDGDRKLYQCMDVTLDDQYHVPVDIGCTNPQGQPPSNDTSSLSPSTSLGSLSSTRSGSLTSTKSNTPSPGSTVTPSGGATSTTIDGLLRWSLVGAFVAIFV